MFPRWLQCKTTYILTGRLAWWLLAFLHSAVHWYPQLSIYHVLSPVFQFILYFVLLVIIWPCRQEVKEDDLDYTSFSQFFNLFYRRNIKFEKKLKIFMSVILNHRKLVWLPIYFDFDQQCLHHLGMHDHALSWDYT